MTTATAVLDDCVPARVMQEPFGCFRACVASLLGLTYEQADGPTPTDYGQIHDYKGWQRWARERGLLIRHSADEDQIANLIGQDVLWIAYIYQQAIPWVAGEAHHCVLVQGDRIVHDPDPVQPQPPDLEGRTLSELPELGWDLFDATVIVWGPDDDGDEPAPRPRLGLARAPFSTATPAVFSGVDSFDQGSATLVGASAPVGGTYTEAGDTDDFTVDTTNHWAQRTATSDTDLNTGQYLRLGSSTPSQVVGKLDVFLTASPVSTARAVRQGIFVRYTDTSNWLMAVFEDTEPDTGIAGFYRARLYKRVAGTVTKLGEGPSTAYPEAWRTISVTVGSDGIARVYVDLQGAPNFGTLPVIAAGDSVLATGGTLASGGFGLYDAYTKLQAWTRKYDNLTVWAPEADAAIYSGKTLEFTHEETRRQSSADATVYGRPAVARGPGVFIPQAGSENKVVRIVAKACRNDITQAPRDNIADSLKLEVRGTSRHLVTPR